MIAILNRRRRIVQRAHPQNFRVGRLERPTSCQHFVSDDCQRVLVCSTIQNIATPLLGRHVGIRTPIFDRRGTESTDAGSDFRGQAKIDKLHGSVVMGDHDILRFHIAVNDFLTVGVVEGAGNGAKDSGQFIQGEHRMRFEVFPAVQ